MLGMSASICGIPSHASIGLRATSIGLRATSIGLRALAVDRMSFDGQWAESVSRANGRNVAIVVVDHPGDGCACNYRSSALVIVDHPGDVSPAGGA